MSISLYFFTDSYYDMIVSLKASIKANQFMCFKIFGKCFARIIYLSPPVAAAAVRFKKAIVMSCYDFFAVVPLVYLSTLVLFYIVWSYSVYPFICFTSSRI